MAIQLHKPLKKIDPAFEVKMPGGGKEKLYEVSVIVKGYNEETAITNFGEANINDGKFHVAEVIEGKDENVVTIFIPKKHTDIPSCKANGGIN